MDSREKQRKFLAYINNPMSRESIMMVYDANNVKYEKCQLYGDYVQSLLRLAFATYMGDDVTSIEQQIEHFNWCWNKNRANFETEGVAFYGLKLYEYFSAYMLEVFYPAEKAVINQEKTSIKLWLDVFDYNKLKTNSEVDTFIEVYNIFDKSLTSE